jgi:hypothetical protein
MKHLMKNPITITLTLLLASFVPLKALIYLRYPLCIIDCHS